MKEKEKQLFKALCRFREAFAAPSLVEYATPSVLGQLFFNRMQGVAYGTLKENGLLGKVNREFRNSLRAAYEQNVQKNESFQTCIGMLSEMLSVCSCKAAMLKGAYLCMHYPDGYRTSCDADLLVLPKDVTVIGGLLESAGFRQGNVRDDRFVPAARREIIESRMTRGETVPYIKEVNLPFMRFFEVDINFSLDCKSAGGKDLDVLSGMLSDVSVRQEKGISVPTLKETDFFIHLCAHLYKEATSLPWIRMRRDMTLYKYCDIYLLLSEMSDEMLKKVFDRAAELGMEKICAYAVLETAGLFDMNRTAARRMSEGVMEDDPAFCLRVTSLQDRKTLMYRTADVSDRFFMESRECDLMEICSGHRTVRAETAGAFSGDGGTSGSGMVEKN